MKGGRVKRSLEAMHHSGEILHHTLWSASLKQSWVGMMYTPEEFSTGMGFLKLLFRLKGTVLPAVFTSGFFWCVIIIHLLLQGLQHLLHNWEDYTEGYLWTGITGAHPGIDSLPEVNWKVATVSLSLLIFFMVFYINSQYARFMSLYERTVALGGTMMEWAMLVKMYLPEDETGNRRWNAVRYMLASMHLLYYTLHETGGVGPAIEDAEWDAILNRHLLGIHEVQVLENYHGMKPFLSATWALQEVQDQLELDPGSGSTANPQNAHEFTHGLRQEQLVGLFREQALAFRQHSGMILNTLKMQVPFPYFHLINFIMMTNCLLIAYATVPLAAWPISLCIMILFTSVIVGMRTLAISLSDPFGGDEVDFNLEAFLKAAYTDTIAQLHTVPRRASLGRLPVGYDNKPIGNPAFNDVTTTHGMRENSVVSEVLLNWESPFTAETSRYREMANTISEVAYRISEKANTISEVAYRKSRFLGTTLAPERTFIAKDSAAAIAKDIAAAAARTCCSSSGALPGLACSAPPAMFAAPHPASRLAIPSATTPGDGVSGEWPSLPEEQPGYQKHSGAGSDPGELGSGDRAPPMQGLMRARVTW